MLNPLKLFKLNSNSDSPCDLDQETPIFVLGIWRSGTTLMQRILNSVDDVYIWGEQGFFLKHIAEAYFST